MPKPDAFVVIYDNRAWRTQHPDDARWLAKVLNEVAEHEGGPEPELLDLRV